VIGSFLLFGFMFLIFGLLTTKFTLYDIVLNERLKMDPIYPSFFWWKNPKPEVLLKVHIFNITNSDEFISGKEDKLKVEEIEPIIFREYLEHKDVVFHHENSTLSYTVERRLVYKESANIKGILNRTIIIPNIAALSGASHVADNWFLRKSFGFTMKSFKTRPVKQTTVYNYFFNLSDPIL
jgi:scavenger receptor class B, member 1